MMMDIQSILRRLISACLISRVRLPLGYWLAIGWLLGCSLAGCSRRPPELTILVAGDTQGWITPCGCAANQAGGLARRATLVRRAQQSGECLLLDAGGSALGTSGYQQLRFEFLLKGLKQMGLAAHNIGQSETEFSPAQLRTIGRDQGITWLSANLSDHEGHDVGQRALEITALGRRLLVIGVIDPEQVENPQWQVAEPVRAIVDCMSGRQAEQVIVLAYMNEGRLRQLAEKLPEVDFIIGGPTGQTISPSRMGRTTVMSATNKGKFLAELRMKRAPELTLIASQITEVSSTLTENPTQVANLKAYYQRLTELDYSATEAGLVAELATTADGYAIAGSEACAKCHTADDTVWHNSKHAHAWDVLVSKAAHYDPSCQQCHTTGYGLPAGFDNVARSADLVHVGCENCHGPSQAHVDNPRQHTPYQAREQCIRCHDHENSPTFHQDIYWAKIFHQGQKKP